MSRSCCKDVGVDVVELGAAARPVVARSKRWEEDLDAELDESAGSARLSSNAGSNAGVAVGPLRPPMPRRRGRGPLRPAFLKTLSSEVRAARRAARSARVSGMAEASGLTYLQVLR